MTMKVSFSPDEDAFRQEVRAIIRDHYPPETRVEKTYTDLTKQRMLLWPRILDGDCRDIRPSIEARVPPRLFNLTTPRSATAPRRADCYQPKDPR